MIVVDFIGSKWWWAKNILIGPMTVLYISEKIQYYNWSKPLWHCYLISFLSDSNFNRKMNVRRINQPGLSLWHSFLWFAYDQCLLVVSNYSFITSCKETLRHAHSFSAQTFVKQLGYIHRVYGLQHQLVYCTYVSSMTILYSIRRLYLYISTVFT